MGVNLRKWAFSSKKGIYVLWRYNVCDGVLCSTFVCLFFCLFEEFLRAEQFCVQQPIRLLFDILPTYFQPYGALFGDMLAKPHYTPVVRRKDPGAELIILYMSMPVSGVASVAVRVLSSTIL